MKKIQTLFMSAALIIGIGSALAFTQKAKAPCEDGDAWANTASGPVLVNLNAPHTCTGESPSCFYEDQQKKIPCGEETGVYEAD